MDYMQFVDYHRSSNADITIGCIAYDETRASDFGLMKVRAKWQLCSSWAAVMSKQPGLCSWFSPASAAALAS
jgi:ADP-glucose pyrophosphorylase